MRKVQLTIKQEEVAPATTSDLVVMNNGRTLKEELSTNVLDKFSREVTVDTSMSKVIDGTLDGVYESGVMYGRSLVNIKKTVEAITMTGSGQYKGFHLRSTDMIQDLKTDTDYLFVVNVTSNTLEGSTQYSLDFGNTDPNNPNQQAYFTARHYLPYNALGTYKFVLRTKSSFENAVFISRNQILPSCTGGSITFSYMLLEYQEGMENWDIPFFTGLCDVKMPILRNVGKNLLELNDTALVKTQGTNNLLLTKKNGGLLAKKDSCVKGSAVIYIEIPNAVKGRKYQFSATITSTNMNRALSFYGGNTVYSFLVNNNGRGDGSRVVSDICTFNPSWDKFCIVIGDHGTLTEGANISIEISDLCVWEVDTKQTSMPYEDHKSNILRTPETVTLRSLPNGVRDELNLMTGEYIKRIGEIVFDGSQDASKWGTANYENENFIQFYWEDRNVATDQTGGNISVTCNKFPTYSANNLISTNPQKIGVCTRRQGKQGIVFSVTTDDVSTFNRTSITTYFTNNPTVVQYELETPVTTKVALTQSEPIVKIGTELPNGVCDTYNLLTGEHIQRVGKVVLDGSEVWKNGSLTSNDGQYYVSYCPLSSMKKYTMASGVISLTSDKFIAEPPVGDDEAKRRNREFIASYGLNATVVNGESNWIYLSVEKRKIANNTGIAFANYLKSNPVTVWYELKNPIVTKKNGLPNTYGITLPNGITDKYDESTRVYTQNIGRVLLTGEESWFLGMAATENHITFAYDIPNGKVGHCVLSDRFKTQYISSTNSNPIRDEESIICGNRFSAIAGRINITIAKSKLSTPDVSGFIAWLKENPTTVYHELNTPDTFTVYRINVGKVLPNGVCDTYDPITKTYTQNIEETVLNGDDSVTYQLETFDNQPSNTIAVSILNIDYIKQGNGQITSDKIPFGTSSLDGLESILYNHEFKKITIEISKSRLTEPNLASFKQWLQRNPLTVWYQMANSAAYNIDIDLSILHTSTPMIYKNGHIILESSYDGPSLLPEFVYSVPTSKSGVLSTTSKTILKHEQRLHQFEDLLLRESLLMDYRLTLTMLDSM